MADLEDELDQYEEDDNAKPKAAAADLFGDDDDEQPDEEYQYEEDAEEAQQEEEQPQTGQAAAASQVDDRKAALMKLAQKKKREAEGGDEPRKKKKKKGDKEKENLTKFGRPKRDGRLQQEPRPKQRTAGGPEVASDEMEEEAKDDAFIDDEGAGGDEEEEVIGSDVADDEEEDAGNMPPPEEAVEVARGEEEEADDGDDPFGHKKRRRKNKETDQQMAMVVDDKIAKMEAAAEADMEQHEQSRPAIQKLKFLAEVEDFLAQKKYHELFVSAGGLGVLKAWLEPYSDGSLPNTRIRSAVLRACKQLPIDTSREDMKSQLKKSQLGNRVMFLLKCQDETTANRQLARELVQQWSRPIFFDPEAESEKRRIRIEQLKRARVASLQAQQEKETQVQATQKPKPVKYGEAGYRWHASIPQASKLDYVMEPSQEDRVTQVASAAALVPQKDSRFSKKMREVQRKQKSTTARAAKPSVEGRSITIMRT